MKLARRLFTVLVLLLAGGLASLALWGWPLRPSLPVLAIGAPFELASARGGTVNSAALAGKPYGIFFGFTHCPEVCPTTMYEMSSLLKTLGDEAADFRLFFITVDPERDTAERLKDYVANFDSRIEALVPTPAQLPGLASSYRVIYEKVPTSDGSYTMNHTATVFLFGRDGSFRSSISYGEKRESREKKVRNLLASSSSP